MTDVCPYTLGIAISGEVNGDVLKPVKIISPGQKSFTHR